MAKRNPEGAGRSPGARGANSNSSSSSSNGSAGSNSGGGKPASPAKRQQSSPAGARVVTQQPSPSGGAPLRPSSPHRVSPGLAAGHYAGCKWTEPPAPATLPLPPQHWMQVGHSAAALLPPFRAQPHQRDFAQQLKVLLKVHA